MPRSGAPREIPPPLELECLKALWRLREGNVRDVQRTLGPGRKLAYTTVMTLLERLARKGAVERRKSGRSFLYTPVLARDTVRRLAVQELLDGFFGGSPDELLDYMRHPQPQAPEDRAASEPEAESTLDPALL